MRRCLLLVTLLLSSACHHEVPPTTDGRAKDTAISDGHALDTSPDAWIPDGQMASDADRERGLDDGADQRVIDGGYGGSILNETPRTKGAASCRRGERVLGVGIDCPNGYIVQMGPINNAGGTGGCDSKSGAKSDIWALCTSPPLAGQISPHGPSPKKSLTVRSRCPSSTKAVGGGCKCNAADGVLVESGPVLSKQQPIGWHCRCGKGTVTSSVLCIPGKVAAAIGLKPVEAAASTGAELLSPSCPTGYARISGGCLASGAYKLKTSRSTSNGRWLCRWSGTGTPRAIAICAKISFAP